MLSCASKTDLQTTNTISNINCTIKNKVCTLCSYQKNYEISVSIQTSYIRSWKSLKLYKICSN